MAFLFRNFNIGAVIAGFATLCAAMPAGAENAYRIGIEGFQDRYVEKSVDLVEHARYAGITADYIHSAHGYFTSVQFRTDKGSDNYKSQSGIIRGIPQYESELRVISGATIPIPDMLGVKAIVPYLGLGFRHYVDNSKGQVTNTGFYGYDRRIDQLYIPIGTYWEFTHGDLVFSPNLEFDLLIFGRVNSRFRNFDPQSINLVNIQRRGIGVRGEMMVGQKYEDFSWQVGPFVRYWKVPDSGYDINPNGPNAGTYLEPENTRLQTGAAFRVQF